jgi:hypothetical protein
VDDDDQPNLAQQWATNKHRKVNPMNETQDRTQRARTQADRWTPHVAQLKTIAEVQLFAEQRAAKFTSSDAHDFAAIEYRDGSATVAYQDKIAEVNPLFDSEAELVKERRAWLSDFFTLLLGGELEQNGEPRTGWQRYVEELGTIATEFRAGLDEDEDDGAEDLGQGYTDGGPNPNYDPTLDELNNGEFGIRQPIATTETIVTESEPAAKLEQVVSPKHEEPKPPKTPKAPKAPKN